MLVGRIAAILDSAISKHYRYLAQVVEVTEGRMWGLHNKYAHYYQPYTARTRTPDTLYVRLEQETRKLLHYQEMTLRFLVSPASEPTGAVPYRKLIFKPHDG